MWYLPTLLFFVPFFFPSVNCGIIVRWGKRDEYRKIESMALTFVFGRTLLVILLLGLGLGLDILLLLLLLRLEITIIIFGCAIRTTIKEARAMLSTSWYKRTYTGTTIDLFTYSYSFFSSSYHSSPPSWTWYSPAKCYLHRVSLCNWKEQHDH